MGILAKRIVRESISKTQIYDEVVLDYELFYEIQSVLDLEYQEKCLEYNSY